jgi:hypothetical protein
LLNGGSRALRLQQFDICGHMHRLNAPQLADPLPFAPAQEVSSGAAIRRPRVFVADVDGEVFEEAQRGPIPGTGDERGNAECRASGKR